MMSVRILKECLGLPLLPLVKYVLKTQEYCSIKLDLMDTQRFQLSIQTEFLTIEESEMRKWFDFGKDQVMKIENIIRACFANPQRKSIPIETSYNAPYAGKECKLCSDKLTAELLLGKIRETLPKAMKQFDSAKIKTFEERRLLNNSP